MVYHRCSITVVNSERREPCAGLSVVDNTTTLCFAIPIISWLRLIDVIKSLFEWKQIYKQFQQAGVHWLYLFQYADQATTYKACAGLNGMKLGGQTLTVVQAIPDVAALVSYLVIISKLSCVDTEFLCRLFGFSFFLEVVGLYKRNTCTRKIVEICRLMKFRRMQSHFWRSQPKF